MAGVDGTWELQDRLARGGANSCIQYRRAVKHDISRGPSAPPLLTVDIGDFVALRGDDGDEDDDRPPEPWVAQVVEICTLPATDQRMATDRDMLERCSLRWLYRPADLDDEDYPQERLPREPLAPREVCLTDSVDGPDVNSMNVINEVVRVVSDAAELDGEGDDDENEDEAGAEVREGPRAAYFCNRFSWVLGVDCPHQAAREAPDLEGKFWRPVGPAELAKLSRVVTPRQDLFWTRRPQPSSRIPRKSTGVGQKAKGEGALTLGKARMEPKVEPKKLLTLDDLTLDSVLPAEQLALVRSSIAGLTDEQRNALIKTSENDIRSMVDQFDGSTIADKNDFDDRRDELVEERREAFWKTLP